MEYFFAPKVKPPELQELVAKMTSVDGLSFAALTNSESLQYVFQKLDINSQNLTVNLGTQL